MFLNDAEDFDLLVRKVPTHKTASGKLLSDLLPMRTGDAFLQGTFMDYVALNACGRSLIMTF